MVSRVYLYDMGIMLDQSRKVFINKKIRDSVEGDRRIWSADSEGNEAYPEQRLCFQ